MDERIRRYNAWNCHPRRSFRQVVTIAVCLGNAVAYLFFLHPLLSVLPEEVMEVQGLDEVLAPNRAIEITMSIVFLLSFVVTVLAGICTMTIDPVDPLVEQSEAKRREAKRIEQLPRGQVTEDGLSGSCGSDSKPWGCACGGGEMSSEEEFEDVLHCQYCRSSVQFDSKHCWDCNKCVANFDHHCPWLNTCIGRRNYVWFYIVIWSFLVLLGTSSVAGCYVLVQHTKRPENPLGLDVVYIWVIGIILSVINIFLAFLDLSLVIFHTYLCFRQITTYEYITGKVSKRKKETRERSKERNFRENDFERGAPPIPALPQGGLPSPPGGLYAGLPLGGAPRTLPSASPNTAAMPVAMPEESSSAESSSDDSGDNDEPQGFKSWILPQDSDTEVTRELKSFYGAPVSGVGEPEHSPTQINDSTHSNI